ncbi:MAG: hypothetical protein U0167_10490 [bacterium]
MRGVGIALAGVVLFAGMAAHAQTHTQAHHAGTHAQMHAQAASAAKEPEAAKSMTVTGEIVDLGCYLGHGAKGASHKDCATKCIAGGMPMGVLTKEGKLYLLVMSHDNAEPFTKAKDMAAEEVKVTGPVSKRSGMEAIEVDAIELATMAKPATTGTKG